MGTKLKKRDLAAALGVHASLISRYTARGMPTSSVEAAQAWKAANIQPRIRPRRSGQLGLYDYDESRAKREHFAAMLAETEARKAMGELLSADAVAREVASVVTTLRLVLERLPHTVAPQLAGRDETGITVALTEAVERALLDAARALGEIAPTHGSETEISDEHTGAPNGDAPHR